MHYEIARIGICVRFFVVRNFNNLFWEACAKKSDEVKFERACLAASAAKIASATMLAVTGNGSL